MSKRSRRDDELREVGSAVSRVLRRLGAPDPGAAERLAAGWEEVLGPAASHCRVVRLGAGELVVEVDHPAWATRARMSRAGLEALVGERLRLEIRVRR